MDTKKFVRMYTALVRQVAAATTATELVQAMYAINGGRLLPQTVFDFRGRMKAPAVLRRKARAMLKRIIKPNAPGQIGDCLLLRNLAHVAHTIPVNVVALPRSNSSVAAATLRAELLRTRVFDARVFFSACGRPRTTAAEIRAAYQKHYRG